MNIEAEKFKIEMSNADLWNTAFDIFHRIEHSLKTHWVNYQDAWILNEKNSLERCKIMFMALGRPDIYDGIFESADKIFKEFNKQKK